ncbi:hypothetical protein GEMRC1_005065 [Eukaryota sp. GEM-RC1]
MEKIQSFCSPDLAAYKDILLVFFTQYNLHLQLLEATQYAAKHGVCVKGDIPIGVDRNSVDAWKDQDEYKLDRSIGAPPDPFSATGQNWLFLPYDFDVMLSKSDPLAWWTTRMKHMSIYFHAFRIDHVIGLFRIWEIRADAKTAIMGRFEPTIKFSESDLRNQYGLWDFERLSLPYVTEDILGKWFGFDKDEVQGRYFIHQHDRLQFKPELLVSELAMLSKLDKDLAKEVKENPDQDKYMLESKYFDWKNKLLSLWNERVLIEEEEHGQVFYYPLFDAKKTTSFRHLSPGDQAIISTIHELYCYRTIQNDVWKSSAYRKLPQIAHCHDMLVCGEDLGVVPACVEETLEDLRILGLRIQRMPPNPKKEFGHPDDPQLYNWMTVSSPSTHDMPSLQHWCLEDRDRLQRFCSNILGVHEIPGASDIAMRVFQQHIYGRSMWTIFLVQDLISISDRLRREILSWNRLMFLLKDGIIGDIEFIIL